MLDLVYEYGLGIIAMPAPIATGTDKESGGRIYHYRTLISNELIADNYARTHLGHKATVVPRNNLELYSTLHLPIHIRLTSLGHIPQTDIVCRGTTTIISPAYGMGELDIVTHHARWRPSGNATTHDTTPELRGLRNVFQILGVPDAARPVWRTSYISTVPFLRPTYI